jgi:RNA polymerase sigma factor FliA
MTTHVSAHFAPKKNASLSSADYVRFLPLVRRIATKLARRLPSHIELDDLMSLGWIGLAEALSRAPISIPMEEFEAFASKRVKGAMLDYLRGLDPNARACRNAARRLSRANATGTAAQTTTDNAQASAPAKFEHVDIDTANPASHDLPADEMVSRSMMAEKVRKSIGDLPQREQLIVSLYYRDECTLKEIGAVLGITESRVSQLLSATVRQIREQVAQA